MRDIELKAITTYQKNLEFLSRRDPDLLARVTLFDRADLEIKPKYDLEYISKGGYFDIVELSSGSYLYGEDSSKFAKESANRTTLQKDKNTFESRATYNINAQRIEDLLSQREYSVSNLKDLLPTMSYYVKHIKPSSSMLRVEKFIFLGVGLGTHIKSIDEKLQSSYYLIVEDNLEIFRLSLFVTPYYELSPDATIYFAISLDDEKFNAVIDNFLERSFFYNMYLKYMHFLPHSNQKIRLIQRSISMQDFMIFAYDTLLHKHLLPLSKIRDGFSYLNLNSNFAKLPLVQQRVLVFGAGPSLAKNIEFVKSSQESFIIITVSSALQLLSNHGIKPDIVVHIDGVHADGSNVLANFLYLEETYKDSLFIVSSHTPKNVLDQLDSDRVYIFESETYYFDNFGSLLAPCVGTTSLLLAVMLGFKEIYALGLDLALDQISGATHSDTHLYKKHYDLSSKDEISPLMSNRKTLVQVRANHADTVVTTSFFHYSLRSISRLILEHKMSMQSIYNLSDGAYIEHTTPATIDMLEDRSHLNKTMLREEFGEFLQSVSRSSLNQKELASLQIRSQNATAILDRISSYQKREYKNESEYLYGLYGFASDVMKIDRLEHNNLVEVISLYLKYAMPYIEDLINTKELTQKMKHATKIDELFSDGLKRVVQDYKNEVDKMLPNREA